MGDPGVEPPFDHVRVGRSPARRKTCGTVPADIAREERDQLARQLTRAAGRSQRPAKKQNRRTREGPAVSLVLASPCLGYE